MQRRVRYCIVSVRIVTVYIFMVMRLIPIIKFHAIQEEVKADVHNLSSTPIAVAVQPQPTGTAKATNPNISIKRMNAYFF